MYDTLNTSLFNHLRDISQRDKATDKDMLFYVMEEVGEAASAMSVELNLKNKLVKENAEQEAIDAVISLLGFISRRMSYEDFMKYFNAKLSKWEVSVETNRE